MLLTAGLLLGQVGRRLVQGWLHGYGSGLRAFGPLTDGPRWPGVLNAVVRLGIGVGVAAPLLGLPHAEATALAGIAVAALWTTFAWPALVIRTVARPLSRRAGRAWGGTGVDAALDEAARRQVQVLTADLRPGVPGYVLVSAALLSTRRRALVAVPAGASSGSVALLVAHGCWWAGSAGMATAQLWPAATMVWLAFLAPRNSLLFAAALVATSAAQSQWLTRRERRLGGQAYIDAMVGCLGADGAQEGLHEWAQQTGTTQQPGVQSLLRLVDEAANAAVDAGHDPSDSRGTPRPVSPSPASGWVGPSWSIDTRISDNP